MYSDLLSLYLCPSYVPEPSPAQRITFSHCVFSGSPQLWTVPQMFLIFDFNSFEKYFIKCPSIQIYLVSFSWLTLDDSFWKEHHRGKCCSQHNRSRVHTSYTTYHCQHEPGPPDWSRVCHVSIPSSPSSPHFPYAVLYTVMLSTLEGRESPCVIWNSSALEICPLSPFLPLFSH